MGEPKQTGGGGKLNREAHAAGRAAREAGKDRDAHPDYPKRSLVGDWQRGWDEAAPLVRVQEPEVRVAVVSVEVRALNPLTYWPDDKPLPTKYHRPPVPCTTCKRLLDNEGGRAVVVRFIDRGVAHFRCRATPGCPGMKLPVER